MQDFLHVSEELAKDKELCTSGPMQQVFFEKMLDANEIDHESEEIKYISKTIMDEEYEAEEGKKKNSGVRLTVTDSKGHDEW